MPINWLDYNALKNYLQKASNLNHGVDTKISQSTNNDIQQPANQTNENDTISDNSDKLDNNHSKPKL